MKTYFSIEHIMEYLLLRSWQYGNLMYFYGRRKLWEMARRICGSDKAKMAQNT